MAKTKQKPVALKIDISKAAAAAARLCTLMDWPNKKTNVFEVWRSTGKGEALAIGLAKVNELSSEIERLRGIVDFIGQPAVMLAIEKGMRMKLSVLLDGRESEEEGHAR
jgi:hypothetical protein